MHLPVVNGGLDFDGIGAGVFKLVVQIAPENRRVHAAGHVIDQIHMRLALHGLEIRQQDGVVDGRGDLTDAAAQLRLGFSAVNVGDGLLVALLLGALANDLVERENLAGHNNCAVNGLAGQLQVGGTVPNRSMVGVGLAQNVLEQPLAQGVGVRLRLKRRHPNAHLVAGLRSGQCLGQLVLIEAIAILAIGNLSGLGVHRRLHGVLAVPLPELVHVHRLLRKLDLIGQGRAEGCLGILGVCNGFIGGLDQRKHVLGMNHASDGRGLDYQILIRSVLVLIAVLLVVSVLPVVGGVLQRNHRLLKLDAVFLRNVLGNVFQRGVVYGHIVAQIDHVGICALLADALIQIRTQTGEIQPHVKLRMIQNDLHRFLGHHAAGGAGRKRQNHVLIEQQGKLIGLLLQFLSRKPLQLRRRHDAGGGRVGSVAAGRGAGKLRQDQNPGHKHDHTGGCGKEGPDLSLLRLIYRLISHGERIIVPRGPIFAASFKFSFCQRYLSSLFFS